ncbi:MAG: Arm DNA-binding domain-containing protein [Vicinamibacterales bacterium]
MARTALTDRFVAGLRPGTRADFFDSKAKGLPLRATPSGAKTWAFVYRAAGKPQWLTLGSYPAVTLADARALALDKRRGVDIDTRDPAAEQRAQRKSATLPPAVPPPVFTFTDLAAFYETFAKGRKKTWKDDVN